MAAEHHSNHDRDARALSKANWALMLFLGIAAFFLFSEHRAHLFGFLPFLLLLICPLAHFFMHGKHGSHEGESSHPHDRGNQTEGDVR
jgi:hypothetical protein